jgi:Flp pilus assembly pilin Flp
MTRQLFRFVRELIADDHAQDLIEYALLGSLIGLVGVAAFSSIQAAIASTYQAWNTNNNNNWQMPDPGGS